MAGIIATGGVESSRARLDHLSVAVPLVCFQTPGDTRDAFVSGCHSKPVPKCRSYDATSNIKSRRYLNGLGDGAKAKFIAATGFEPPASPCDILRSFI
jgi:hypothetical protein